MIDQDIKDIQDFFGRPFLVPAEFKSWMADQFALAVPSIPISQLVGGRTIERIIDINTTPVSVSGDAEQTVYTLALPGKTIAKNGRLHIDMAATIQDAAATHSAIMNVKIDGTTIGSVQQRATIAAADPMRAGVIIWNRNDYASQVVEAYQFNVIKTITFGTTDLSIDRTLTITIDWITGDGDDIWVKKSAVTTVYNPEPAT